MKLKRPLRGGETGGDVYAVQRALNAAPSNTVIKVTKAYDTTTKMRVTSFQKAHRIDATGLFGQKTLDKLWEHFDLYGRARYRMYPHRRPLWMDIGSPTVGGPSFLDYDLTHDTTGPPLLDHFIAVDLAFKAGQVILAPEDMVVDTQPSSAHPGEAFYATGRSLRWWIAHHDTKWPLGARLKKGQHIGRVVPTDIGGGPHAHYAVNAEKLLGNGRQFLYGRTGTGPDYTHGSPTVREQLERLEL